MIYTLTPSIRKDENVNEKIFYWPDGCWCRSGEFENMQHKSDDFGLTEVSLFMDDEAIDRHVDSLVS